MLTPAEGGAAQLPIRTPDAAVPAPHAAVAVGDPRIGALVRLIGVVVRREPLPSYASELDDLFGGDIPWNDADHVGRLITVTIPSRVAADRAFVNATHSSDEQNARIEHANALRRVMTAVINDDTEFYGQFTKNQDFRRWMTGVVFDLTSNQVGAAP